MSLSGKAGSTALSGSAGAAGLFQSRWIFFPIFIVAAALFLSGCAETQLGTHVAKSVMRDGQPSGAGGVYKVGSPYQIFGVWYYPAEDETYDSTGIASWYGPQFHGKPTANGEIFDMHAISAAHPTLPMPTLARVTNLENGRSIVVRINDRGPFAKGREIDLSRRAAELLGYLKQGTAKVRVQYLSRAPLPGEPPVQVASAKETFVMPAPETPVEALKPVPTGNVQTAALAGSQAAAPKATMAPIGSAPTDGMQPIRDDPVSPQPGVDVVPVTGPNQLYVQAGAFSNIESAQLVQSELAALGDVTVTPVNVSGRTLYRVRVPANNVEMADTLLNSVVDKGHHGARIIVE